jgi:hypothetical protein
MKTENEFTFVDVSAENVSEVGICCSKDKKSPGFIAKAEWFKSSLNSIHPSNPIFFLLSPLPTFAKKSQ